MTREADPDTGKSIKRHINGFIANFKSIVKEVKISRRYTYEIAGWVQGRNRDDDRLVIHILGTDKYLRSLTVSQIYQDDQLIQQFHPLEIKFIATLAISLYARTEAKYEVVWQDFRDKLAAGTIKLKNKDKPEFIKMTIIQFEKDMELVDTLSPRDAYRLGKTVAEFID